MLPLTRTEELRVRYLMDGVARSAQYAIDLLDQKQYRFAPLPFEYDYEYENELVGQLAMADEDHPVSLHCMGLGNG